MVASEVGAQRYKSIILRQFCYVWTSKEPQALSLASPILKCFILVFSHQTDGGFQGPLQCGDGLPGTESVQGLLVLTALPLLGRLPFTQPCGLWLCCRQAAPRRETWTRCQRRPAGTSWVCLWGFSVFGTKPGGVHFVLMRKVAHSSPFERTYFPYTYLQFLNWFSEMFYMVSLTSY